MAFLEVEFPRNISYHAVGGPGFSTIVNEALSGQEQRNRNWATARGKWNVSLMTPPPSQLSGSTEASRRQSFIDMVNAFFLNVGGKADSFRLLDHKDNSLAGQTLGVGTGAKTTFQLIKTYTIGGRSYIRNITKPVWHTALDYRGIALADSVTIALNGAPLAMAGNWTLDATTGIVTFASAPGAGVVVTAPAGKFHYPVRFDTDELPIQVEESSIGGSGAIISVHSIQLIETLAPNY